LLFLVLVVVVVVLVGQNILHYDVGTVLALAVDDFGG
jgi:hypothetical protein